MSFWQNHPGIKLVIPFLFGIIASIEMGINSSYFLLVSLLFLLFCGVSFYLSTYALRKKIGFLFFIALFFAGFTYSSYRTEKFSPGYFGHTIQPESVLVVTLVDNLQEKENSYKTTLHVSQVIGDSEISTTGKVLAYFKKDSASLSLKYGDKLLVKNSLNPIESHRNPDQFDYKNYLNLNQINFQTYLKKGDYQLIAREEGNPIFAFSQKMRQRLYGYLKSNGVEGNQLKVASALLLGYKENLDKELVKSYASAGAMHVLAVSGLHVGILYLLLTRIFGFLKKIRRGKLFLALIVISSLWFYAIMTGLSASVMRATTMFSFIVVGNELIHRKSSIYNTLAVSAIVLMIINPFIVYQVGFQLSYVAVLGIVYLQPKLSNLVYSKYKFIRGIWAITCVSIAAQIATFPLSLHYFHQFPTYFFISNLIVIPAAFCVFYLGVFLFIIAPFGGLSLVVGKVVNSIVWVLNQAVYYTEDLPVSLIEEIEFTVFETYFLYAIIVAILYAIHKRRYLNFKLAFTLVIVFCGIQIYWQYQCVKQHYFTFYSINKLSVLEYTRGNEVYFISNKELQNDWSMMLFNVNNHWNSHNILSKKFLNIDSLSKDISFSNLWIRNGVVVAGNKTIWIFDNEQVPPNLPDFVWVRGNKLKGLSSYLKRSTPSKVIFDSSVPNYKVSYYLPLLDSHRTEVINLNENYLKVPL